MGRDSCRNVNGSCSTELHKFCPQQIKPVTASFALSLGSQALLPLPCRNSQNCFYPKHFIQGFYMTTNGVIQKSYILAFGPGRRYSCCLRGGDKTLSGCVKSCRHTWLKSEICSQQKDHFLDTQCWMT